MIDQGEHAGFLRALHHAARFISVHRHRLLAQDGLPSIERGQRHLAMRDHRSHDADKINVIAGYQRAPVAFDVFDIKLARDFFRVFATRAGNRDDARAFTVFESRDLGGAREARANNSDANRVFHDRSFIRVILQQHQDSGSTGSQSRPDIVPFSMSSLH